MVTEVEVISKSIVCAQSEHQLPRANGGKNNKTPNQKTEDEKKLPKVTITPT